MKFVHDIKELTLEQKINQLFIAGFQGSNPFVCKNFADVLSNGLGGVIFFSENIESEPQFKDIILKIKENALVSPFLSIDQEGGRVERTENIHNGKKYLSAKFAAQEGLDFLLTQTAEMSRELLSYGINMNFAPVLDVNTNANNPIIGERAYSDKTNEVIRYSSVVTETYLKNRIVPVGKHFPGHGDASLDSHKKLPVIDLKFEQLENVHIRPFSEAIKNGIPAVMVAHVHYPAFDEQTIPASLSENVIKNYLINKLGFDGIVISDDMVMGALQGYSPIDACIRALNAGIDMFIFRNFDAAVEQLTFDLKNAVRSGHISEVFLDEKVKKIWKIKKDFTII